MVHTVSTGGDSKGAEAQRGKSNSGTVDSGVV